MKKKLPGSGRKDGEAMQEQISRFLDNVMATDIDAEQGVLGGLLLDHTAIERVINKLQPEDFSMNKHQLIYKEIKILHENGLKVDLITLADKLRQSGNLDHIGGAVYLSGLIGIVLTSRNIEYYAQRVLEKALLRALLGVIADKVPKPQEKELKGIVKNLLFKQLQFMIDISALADDYTDDTPECAAVQMAVQDILVEAINILDEPVKEKEIQQLCAAVEQTTKQLAFILQYLVSEESL